MHNALFPASRCGVLLHSSPGVRGTGRSRRKSADACEMGVSAAWIPLGLKGGCGGSQERGAEGLRSEPRGIGGSSQLVLSKHAVRNALWPRGCLPAPIPLHTVRASAFSMSQMSHSYTCLFHKLPNNIRQRRCLF